jgi:hypothetical protein
MAAPSLFGGVSLGVTLAVYFALIGERTLVRAVGVIALSWVAYLLAWSIAFVSALVLVAFGVASLQVPVFIGGAAGGLILSASTTFRLYAPNPAAGPTRIACAIAGGALGVIGVWLAVAPESNPLQISTPVLCGVWQTGIGFVLGLTSPADTIGRS